MSDIVTNSRYKALLCCVPGCGAHDKMREAHHRM